MSKGNTKGPQWKTLEERIEARYYTKTYKPGSAYQVRAELDRLKRQIMKLPVTTGEFYGEDGRRTCVRRSDVLALLREAKR